jgi:exosortase
MKQALSWRAALALWITWSAAVLALCWPTVLHLTDLWRNAESYHYAWLVLPAFAYFSLGPWRHRFQAHGPRPSAAGLWLAAAAGGLWLLGVQRDLMAAQHLGLVLALLAGFPAVFGTAVSRQVMPLLCLLLLMFPNGDLLQPLLRTLTLFWAKGYALLLGLPLEVDAYRVAIDGLRYRIEPACAGLPTFNLFLFLGFAFGLTVYRTLAPVIFAAAGCALVAVLANALRIAAILTLDRLRGTQLDFEAHQDIQFVIVSLLLLLLVTLVARKGGATQATSSPPAQRALTPS